MSSPISGFTAIPNPQMLAFMPIQSYLMMYFAGAGWQIGKRKISAIPNEQFNKLSANDMLKDFTADLRETIPTLERSLQDITPLVNILIKQYGEFAREIINELPQIAKELADPTLSQAQLGFEKLFHRLTTSAFPNFPSAGAVHREEFTPQSGQLQEFENTEAKRIEIQRLQTQQNQRQQDLIKAKIAAAERKNIRSITPQFGAAERARLAAGRKRPAGQSQKLEKDKLVHTIKITKELLEKNRFNTLGERLRVRIKNMQQQLANLLARYQF